MTMLVTDSAKCQIVAPTSQIIASTFRRQHLCCRIQLLDTLLIQIPLWLIGELRSGDLFYGVFMVPTTEVLLFLYYSIHFTAQVVFGLYEFISFLFCQTLTCC